MRYGRTLSGFRRRTLTQDLAAERRTSRTPHRILPELRRAERLAVSLPCPRQGSGLHDFPWGNRFGPGNTVGQTPLQLHALCRGERGGRGLTSDAVPDRLGYSE